MACITEIKVQRWRHFEFSAPLNLKPGVNLILGKNGSGKTSFLRMVHDASINQNQSLNDSPEPDGTHLVEITLQEDGNTISVNNAKTGTAGNWNNTALQGKVRYITSQRSITSGNSTRNPLAQSFGDISVLDPGQAIDVAEEFNKAIIKELYDRVVELSSSTDFLTELQEDYQKELVDFEKTLKIDPKKENAVYFVDYRDREVSIGDLSSGEKEYLYFYAFLRRIQGAEGEIILIDEPELHLHSSQIRKLCELIANLALKNQVIIATHSGEVLQHFISQANIILLSKGVVEHIDNPDQMRKVLEDTGLPIDPSVFTAHWICAENEPTKSLPGGGATTPEVLSWIFGNDMKKRYWSFGSDKARALAFEGGIASAGTGLTGSIQVSPILDGDKLIKAPADFPPTVPAPTSELGYFPFWELENAFLSEPILDAVIAKEDEKTGSQRFWEKVETNKAGLLKQVKKTVAKNNLRQFSLDKYIDTEPEGDIEKWKADISGSSISLSDLDGAFDVIVAEKNWKWLPGKEAIVYALELSPDFWVEIRKLQQDGSLQKMFKSDPSLKDFIDAINAF